MVLIFSSREIPESADCYLRTFSMGPPGFHLVTIPGPHIYEAGRQNHVEIWSEVPSVYSISLSSYLNPIVSIVSQCLVVVGDWMQVNRMKLNPDKIEVIVAARPCDLWGIGAPLFGLQLPPCHSCSQF